MALVNGYADLAALKARLRLAVNDTLNDERLESSLLAASRTIDQWAGRRFYAVSETRLYGAVTPWRLLLPDDLLSITALKVDVDGDRTHETTLVGSDYYLLPGNAPLDGRPYTEIEIDPMNGSRCFPRWREGVQIAGNFGYCVTGAHPAPIGEATLRLAERLFKLSDAPLGVTGSVELGAMRIAADRDLQDLLWPYRRIRGLA